jgi:SH3-like domain-containing protein
MAAFHRRFPSLRSLSAALVAVSLAGGGFAAETPKPAQIKGDRTNVRAKPSYDGEVLATLSKGASVEVLAEVDGAEGEPGGSRRWARIQLPKEVSVWVYTPLLEAQSKTVKGEVLKFRAGPGRNYSELGELKRGEAVTEIRQAEDWTQIEPPPQAVAYVAASLIEFTEPPAPVALETKPVEPDVIPAIRLKPASQPTVMRLPAEAIAAPADPVPTPSQPQPSPGANIEPVVPVVIETSAPAPAVTSVEPAVEAPAARAVVREGVVRRTAKLQAPGDYELRSVRRVGGLFNRDEGLIDFLVVENPDVKLERWEGKRVFIHGTEWRDERWRTPMLKVERVDTAAY